MYKILHFVHECTVNFAFCIVPSILKESILACSLTCHTLIAGTPQHRKLAATADNTWKSGTHNALEALLTPSDTLTRTKLQRPCSQALSLRAFSSQSCEK